MFFLFLCILANVGIFLTFRYFGIFKVETLEAIVVNYMICVITGLTFVKSQGIDFGGELDFTASWPYIGMALGVVFIATFYLMAVTTQKMGVTVSTVANKMALVIPVLVSLFVLKTTKNFYAINYLGIILALVAILLTSLKKKKTDTAQQTLGSEKYLLPLSVFLLGGVIDTTFSYVNTVHLRPETAPVFPIVVFATAGIVGTLVLTFQKRVPNKKSIIGGLVLGLINYFSIYFLLQSLNAFDGDGAIVFPTVNIGIIVFSALLSIVLFRELLTRLNIFGLLCAVLAIVLITYQEGFFS